MNSINGGTNARKQGSSPTERGDAITPIVINFSMKEIEKCINSAEKNPYGSYLIDVSGGNDSDGYVDSFWGAENHLKVCLGQYLGSREKIQKLAESYDGIEIFYRHVSEFLENGLISTGFYKKFGRDYLFLKYYAMYLILNRDRVLIRYGEEKKKSRAQIRLYELERKHGNLVNLDSIDKMHQSKAAIGRVRRKLQRDRKIQISACDYKVLSLYIDLIKPFFRMSLDDKE